jgi:TRAP-type C4-dicarboxylate transport system substrate-binding protein
MSVRHFLSVLWVMSFGIVVASPLLADGREAIVGGRAAPGTPGDVYWAQFKDSVVSLSNGRLQPKMFIRGEVGPEETLFARLRRNQLHLGGISTSTITLVEPALEILRAPFLFDSQEEVGFVLDNYVRAPVADLLDAKNLVMFDWQSAGWLNFYAKMPIILPEDIRNKRIRISVDAAALLFIQEVDADYVQVSFSDILPSLQTGLIDGGEQSTQLFVTGGFGRYAPHFTLSRHAYVVAAVIGNKEWFDSLSIEDQTIYRQSVPTDAWYRSFYVNENDANLARAKAEGQVIHELTPAQRQVWKNRTSDVARKIIDRSGVNAQSLYDAVLAGKAAFARQ